MTPPALMVAGDHDQSPLSVRGPDWWTDTYTQSPGAKSLLTLFGAEHSLGGITGYASTATLDENLERVALIQRLTSAYLRTAFNPVDPSWSQAESVLEQSDDPLGRLETKYTPTQPRLPSTVQRAIP